MRMTAKLRSQCRTCKRQIEVGDLILYLPPKGRRRYAIVAHDACAKQHGAAQKAKHDKTARESDWPAREHTRAWTTDREFRMVEEAMAKRV